MLILVVMLQKGLCGAYQPLLLLWRDRHGGPTKGIAAAIANFNKHQPLRLAHDEIDLTQAATEVFSNQLKSTILEVELRQALGPAAPQEVFGQAYRISVSSCPSASISASGSSRRKWPSLRRTKRPLLAGITAWLWASNMGSQVASW